MTQAPMPLKIAITPGDPAGIGPDVLVQAAQYSRTAALVAFADPDLLKQRAKLLGLSLTIQEWQPSPDSLPIQNGGLYVVPVPLRSVCHPGTASPDNIPYVVDTLAKAVDACRAGFCHALVTGPVNKGLFHSAGVPFTGHTEFLAERTRSNQVVMMLQTEGLRVALATTHLPLRLVSQSISAPLLTNILLVLHQEMCSLLGKADPCIYVLGLNPHAGDGGALGTEELETIIPVLKALKARGLNVVGPCSADTAFSSANRQQADVFLAMYHDQGLPVIKTVGFGKIVNITLGLNIIRTSVDHGTAFELAGTGKANPDSMHSAIDAAIVFCRKKFQDLI